LRPTKEKLFSGGRNFKISGTRDRKLMFPEVNVHYSSKDVKQIFHNT
jgi:hypothetical protein